MTDQPEALRVAEILMSRAAMTTDQRAQAARLLREQHAEIERLKIEREKMYDLGYEKGVTDTLLDYGVDP